MSKATEQISDEAIPWKSWGAREPRAFSARFGPGQTLPKVVPALLKCPAHREKSHAHPKSTPLSALGRLCSHRWGQAETPRPKCLVPVMGHLLVARMEEWPR